MDKSSNSSGDSSAAATASSTASYSENRDYHHLRQLNKLSHKISKPTTTVPAATLKRPGFDPNTNIHIQVPPPHPPASNQGNLHQHQPPVYNINKNDFRDVVQRLTGSPAHERISAPSPPPIHQPKPQSSRLQRIRPPPLAHVTNRPPSLLDGTLLNPNHNPSIPMSAATAAGFVPRPVAPLSPLPPLPPVHAAAESPVSAYMRYLQNSMSAVDSNPKQFSGFSPLAPLVSPRWYQQQENAPPLQNIQPPATTVPTSSSSVPVPPPFGCLNSPKSPYGLLSPSILLSPTSGQLGFPQSQTTVPSPKYKGH